MFKWSHYKVENVVHQSPSYKTNPNKGHPLLEGLSYQRPPILPDFRFTMPDYNGKIYLITPPPQDMPVL